MDYRACVRLVGQTEDHVIHFRLEPLPALVTRNKVKKPRLGRWRLVVLESPSGVAPGALMARLERLLYFAGPSLETTSLGHLGLVGGREYRLWRVEVPKPVEVRVDLAELRKDLLVLRTLEGALPSMGVDRVNLELRRVHLGTPPAPAEGGGVLLATLRRLGEVDR